MLIYEYQCGGCEHRPETIQKINDDSLKLYPKCGEEALHKLVSAVFFRLKGAGWYETDFKDKSNGGNNNKNKSATDTGKDKKKQRQIGQDR